MGANSCKEDNLLQVVDWENLIDWETPKIKVGISRHSNFPPKKDWELRDDYYTGIKDNEVASKWNLVNKHLALSSKNFNKGFVHLTNGELIRISSQLNPLIDSIEKSKYILELKDNWDEDGSKAYSKDTWVKAVKFIINYAEWILTNYGKSIISPQIYHGPDGSIDLYWKNSSFNLLINIPEEETSLGTFYGDDYNVQKIEGTLNPEKLLPSLFPSLINFT